MQNISISTYNLPIYLLSENTEFILIAFTAVILFILAEDQVTNKYFSYSSTHQKITIYLKLSM